MVAQCLFFFVCFIDMPKLMMETQFPYLLYQPEKKCSFKDRILTEGVAMLIPFSSYTNEANGLHNAEEENLWESILAQDPVRQPIVRQSGTSDDKIQNRSPKEEDKPILDISKKVVSQNSISENTMQQCLKEGEQKETEESEVSGSKADVHDAVLCPMDVDAYRDFSALVKQFYVIDSTTYIGEEELDIGKLLGSDLSIEKVDNQDTKDQMDYSKTPNPQILIYHTHSQEEYADSIPGDVQTTVQGAGEELARILSREYGFRVLHHVGQYDVGNRDYAYSKALPALQEVLDQNPSIEVVIDLHRDGVADSTRLVTEIDGKKMAQVMLFNGLSRTKRIGEIEYLKNENRQSNLAFSFQLQKKMTEHYPGLARKIYLKGYRYNMHFKPRTLLIELGAQTNTVQEVWNALPPLAHSIAMVLDGE